MNAKYDPTSIALKSIASVVNDLPRIDWDAPNFAELVRLPRVPDQQIKYRLLRISEIGEGKPEAYRQAMTNVISCLNSTSCASVYILSGRPEGIDLYLGSRPPHRMSISPMLRKCCEQPLKATFLAPAWKTSGLMMSSFNICTATVATWE